jgi:hypothetical protein
MFPKKENSSNKNSMIQNVKRKLDYFGYVAAFNKNQKHQLHIFLDILSCSLRAAQCLFFLYGIFEQISTNFIFHDSPSINMARWTGPLKNVPN